MNLSLHTIAQQEYSEAAKFYQGHSESVLDSFIVEIESSINQIIDHPFAWLEVEPEIRRFLTHRFPYAIYYAIEKDSLLILGIVHLSKEQKSYQSRRDGFGAEIL